MMHRRPLPVPGVRYQPSPFGPLALLWSVYRGEPKVCRILITRPGIPLHRTMDALFPSAPVSSCREIDELAESIGRFFQGEAIRFPLAAVRLDLCSDFQRRVLEAEHAIPRGRVSAYHLIARHLGRPGAARAVGAALARNPFPIVIPCHRAVRGDGSLGGYQGGLRMKRALLEMEGVRFGDSGRVAAPPFHYA